MTLGSPDAYDAGAALRSATTRPVGVALRVRTIDGWPVASAVLTVTDAVGQQVVRVTSDGHGALSTEPLPPGTYTAIVTAAGFNPAARTAMVTASGSASLGVIELARVDGAELPSPGIWTIDPSHSAINVTARHLGLASVRGRFAEFGGTIEVAELVERSTVVALIQSASIDTGNKMRDDHLKSPDFLNADGRPLIEYHGTGVTPIGGDKWMVDGHLTLNAITRPVQLEMTYLGVGEDSWGGTRAGFHAVTDLRRDDFAMSYNQILRAGIRAVGTTVRVELDVEAVRGDVLPTV